MNDSDKNVITAALRFRKLYGGRVTAAGSGGSMEKALKEALSLGVDQAVYLKAETAPKGLREAAAFFAAGVQSVAFDVILCGRQAIDGDSAYFAGFLARLLELPLMICVKEFWMEAGRLNIKRDTDAGEEIFWTKGPVCITWAGENKEKLHPTMEQIRRVYSGEQKPFIVTEGKDFDWEPEEEYEELECSGSGEGDGNVRWIEGSNEKDKAAKLHMLLKKKGFLP